MAQPYVKDLLGSTEIVLIETRQHWMAAIRFAMRPIIVALIGLLLLAVNNIFQFNDDQFLSFINDLITWVTVILFLVSIVWIPIDLIRWDSRRYVLTNRRTMRVEGVLQKNSIDSSLDQVTDIGLRETTFGRLLGYADLTMYTASEAANEEYEQLLDGKQFKRAVLDAKEAIRLGGSMDALPDDFVVKGGQNEASMRADGKITDDEPEPEAAASADELPAAAAPAAVAAAEPAAAEPPLAAPEPEPEPAVAPAPEPVAEPALVVEPEDEPAAAAPEPEPEPERAEPEPEASVPEPEPEASVPEPKPEAEPGPAAETALDERDTSGEQPKTS